MITREDDSPVKSRRLQTLEKSWNDTIQLTNQPRRHMQMSKDIRKFLMQSIDGDIHQAQRASAAKSKPGESVDIFGRISSTFNFAHHDGTDAKAEMKVVKIILIREGQVMTLEHLSRKAISVESVAGTCSTILEVLSEIRESTLNYLEALILWRQTIPDGNTLAPRLFIWQGRNYTMKVVNDLDFLADNSLIIDALKISPEQFRSNPLMLTNNLDDPNTWMDPVERAGQDAGGVTQGAVFESRLRLRFAERILLQEIELTSSSIGGDSATFLTESALQQPQGFGQHAAKYQPHYQQAEPQTRPAPTKPAARPAQHNSRKLAKGASALEADYDEDDSYQRQDEGLGGGLADKSLWGLPGELRDQELNKSRSNSGDSDSAIRPSKPNSRSSSINNTSAPNSSQGARALAGAHRAAAPGNNKSGPSTSGTNAGGSLDYGHDFFSGHWAESKPFVGSYDPSLEDYSNANTGRETNPDEHGIFFVDSGTLMSGKVNQGHSFQPQRRAVPQLDSLDDVSVHSTHSMHSIDSVASGEVLAIASVRQPPRNLILAASACVILLTPGPEIPADISWNAFLKMCSKVDVSTKLRALNPVKVHKFKVLAIKPILEQLLDEATYDGLMNNSIPFHEYTAINKLVTWLQNFTALSIARQSQQKTSSILSPSAASMKKHRHPLAGSNNTLTVPNADNELDLTTLPTKKRVIPSASLQLAPFHSEVDATLYKQPLLLALLSAYDRAGTGRTKRKPRPPRSGKFAPEEEDVKSFDRLVVKVYDVTGSAEYLHTLIIREYELLLEDLQDAYHNRAHVYFQPTKPAWWATHIKTVLVIEPKPGDKLKIKISKKAIEDIVAAGVEHGMAPLPLLKLKDLTPAPRASTPGANKSPSPAKKTAAASPARAKGSDLPGATKPPLGKKAPASESGHLPASAKAAPSTAHAAAAKPTAKVAAPGTVKTKAAQPATNASTSAKAVPVDATKTVSSKSKAPAAAAPAHRAASPATSSKPIAAAVPKAAQNGTSTKASVAVAPKAASAKSGTNAPALQTTAVAKAPSAVAPPVAVAPSAPAQPAEALSAPEVEMAADADYGEDFESNSVVEQGAPALDGAVSLQNGVARAGNSKPGTAGEYAEDFEEENSAGGTAATHDDATHDDANTANAVMSAADTHSDTQASGGGGEGGAQNVVAMREGDNRYYSDFEENSLDNASGIIIDDGSSVGNDAVPINRSDSNRPLSAIEQAQREFDEIGEDDGEFFNSVDYEEDF